MAGYLLDTNHMGFCLNPASHLRERIHASHRSGNRFGTCVPVLCELAVFISGSPKPEKGRRILTDLLYYVKVWPLELPDSDEYAKIYFDLRRRGRIMSQVDMMVAALCRRMNVTLLTTDRDFEALPDLGTENWVSP
jgi:tRNA(fMet)-specific endonuclease VapC